MLLRNSRLVDETNQFQVELSEFMYLFGVPFEKTIRVMQEKNSGDDGRGTAPNDIKDYYNMYIKTLEGQYVTMLKSPEYVRAMSNTISALVKYKQAKEEVFCTNPNQTAAW